MVYEKKIITTTNIFIVVSEKTYWHVEITYCYFRNNIFNNIPASPSCMIIYLNKQNTERHAIIICIDNHKNEKMYMKNELY